MMAKRAHGRHDVFDEDDGQSLRREAPNHGHAALQLPRAQARQPFVEQDDARLGSQRARELGALLLDIGELVESPIGLGQKVQLAEETGGLVARILETHSLARTIEHTGHDGADDRHIGGRAHQLKGAVDALAHAQMIGKPCHVLAAHADGAAVRLDGAGN